MDVIITAFGEVVWASSCIVVNFCLSSGLSALSVFVSFLCAILASAFYKYTITRPQMSLDDTPDVINTAATLINEDASDAPPTTEHTETIESTTEIPSDSVGLSEIEICIEEHAADQEETMEDNHETVTSNILVDTIEGTEEEIQKQQIQNIYRLLNEQHLTENWSSGDFLEQLRMYGLNSEDDAELELL